jgi:hypothetical protein
MSETTTETPAALLRRAAGLMRQRAEAAPPGPWHWKAAPKGYPQAVSSVGVPLLIAETYTGPGAPAAEAEHIASWSPVPALAVARLLENRAAQYDLYEAHCAGTGKPVVVGAGGDEDPALTVARAYLGEPS